MMCRCSKSPVCTLEKLQTQRVYVRAEVDIPSENLEKVCSVIQPLITKTRQEKGCIFYSFTKVIGSGNTYSFIEEWESEEDLDEHLKSKHIAEYLEKVQAEKLFNKDTMIIAKYKPIY